MSSDVDYKRRATRLLRWYPATWHERYGDEFADHLEQEFADRPVDIKRTLNVALNGLVARVGDWGLTNSDLKFEGESRAAIGTSFTLIVIASVFTLNFWSLAVGRWSSRRYHPLPDTITTGILTVTAGLLILVLIAIILAAAISATRQVISKRSRRLVGPSLLATGAGAFIVYAARWLPMELVQYTHSPQGRPGIQWSHPGRAVAALAQSTWDLTQTWVSLWTQKFHGVPTSQIFVNDMLPIAFLILGIAIAVLLRRVEFPLLSERAGSVVVALLGALLGAFMLALLVWFQVGGPSGSSIFVTEGPSAGKSYLVFLALVAVLVGRSGLRLARRNPLLGRLRLSESGGYVA